MERALTELVSAVRRAGVRVSTSEAIDLARAVEKVGLAQAQDVRLTIRAVLAKRWADRAQVDRVVDAFFAADGRAHQDLYERLSALGFLPHEVQTLRETLAATARSDPSFAVYDAVRGGPLAVDRLLEIAGERLGLGANHDPARAGFLTMRLLDQARFSRAQSGLEPLRSRLRDALGARGDALVDALADELSAFRRRARNYVLERISAKRPALGLEHTAFGALDGAEAAAVERAVTELAQRLIGRALVRARRARRGRVDVRATMRRALVTGGVPFRVSHRGRSPRRPRLVLLCDVSDSVRATARFMLLFVHAVQRLFEDARSFVFVSELGDATPVFKREHAARAVELAYGGGVVRVSDNSHYGRVWQCMAKDHADVLGPRTTLVVLGDGRTNHFDAGERAFAELAARVHRVLWFSPEPESAWRTGDSALALYAPHAEQVLPVYDLATLEKAARTLARF